MRRYIPGRLAALGLAFVLTSCGMVPPTPDYDLLIRGGTIVDGTGAAAYAADLAIEGGVIARIGDLEGVSATRVIDASGLVVTPGFIDLHTHADRNILDNPDAENYLRQGVTTILAGNCGSSPVDLAAYFQSVETTGVALNLGMLIGHNNVRAEVMGNVDRAPTEAEQTRMEALVETGMRDGAFGLSSGLIYLPGTYSETNEVTALARVAAGHGGIYATHIRNEFELLQTAVEEAITIGFDAGIPVQLSHLKVAHNNMWGQSGAILDKIARARDQGLDIGVDQYPYEASSTGFDNVLPAWARAGTRENLQARLDDPETRARIKADTIAKLNGARAAGDLSRIVIASFEDRPEFSGRTLAEITAMHGLEPTVENGAEAAMRLLHDGEGSAIYFMMTEEDIVRIMRAPFTSIASDSSAVDFGKDVPHLRNYGTYPRVLRKYVREDGVLSLEAAIHKMTAMPAGRIGLATRGVLAAGMVADINVFDSNAVSDHDDWAHPHQYATGFEYVLVGGLPVIDAGERTRIFPGKVLKKRH